MRFYFPLKSSSISSTVASVFVYVHWSVYGFYRWVPYFFATLALSSFRLTADLVNREQVDRTRRIAADIRSAVCFYSDGFRFLRRTMLEVPEDDGSITTKGPFDFECIDLKDFRRASLRFLAVDGSCAVFWIYTSWSLGLV